MAGETSGNAAVRTTEDRADDMSTIDEVTARMCVAVPVTGLWRAPDRPRAVDAPMLLDEPAHAAWLADMDAHPVADEDGRTGLLDRLDSQLLEGEPVEVLESTDDGWSRVTCPWQPAGADLRGYEGWVRSAHLREGSGAQLMDLSARPLDPDEFLQLARTHLGLGYLWGGLSRDGLDCSGLVHHTARELGVVVPRDAHDQQRALEPVEPDDVRTGDLYFFAHPGKAVHHVGIVVEPGVMLHAPESGARVVEEPLSDARRETLVAASRIVG